MSKCKFLWQKMLRPGPSPCQITSFPWQGLAPPKFPDFQRVSHGKTDRLLLLSLAFEKILEEAKESLPNADENE